MNIFIAGDAGTKEEVHLLHRFVKNRLLPFVDFAECSVKNAGGRCVSYEFNKINQMKRENKVHLFLDSGAFSAWTQKTTVDIHEYIDFIKQHSEYIDMYANLDVIGIGGKQPNEKTAKLTLKNQEIMEAAGLHPIPCFHFGEPYQYLQYYVDNYEYLALGVAGNSGLKLMPWLDECFSKYICDDKGFPLVKVHGFAVTSLKVMVRYPWYSVDSTSWVVNGRMGSIFMPRWADGKWIYDGNSWKISVSNRSPDLKNAGSHYETCSPVMKKIILRYVEEKGYKFGKSEFHSETSDYELKDNEKWLAKPKNPKDKRVVETIIEEGIANSYQLRDEMNILYFLDLEESLPKYPWAFSRGQTSIFD